MFASGKTSAASTGGYQISRSLRFNSADSTTLNRTFATNGTSRTTATISFWTKLTSMSASQSRLIDCYDGSGADSSGIYYENNVFTVKFGGSGSTQVVTTAVYRDPSAWYHLCAVFDSTQATSTNRIKFYVNGVQVTTFSSASYPNQNATYAYMSSGVRNYIGDGWNAPATYLVNLYLAEFFYIDGQALTPSSFGQTDAQTGVWSPIAYAGTYGTNGFYLNFSDNSNTTAATLGKDYSGNGNNWTPNNFSVTAGAGNDSLVDSPTSYGVDTGVGGTVRGNYATFNPLVKLGTVPLVNGNLDTTSTASSNSTQSTIAVSSGKWYVEFVPSSRIYPRIGVQDITETDNNMSGTKTICWGGGNELFINGSSVGAYGQEYVGGDVIGVAVDVDTRKVWFSKNGTWINFTGSGADPATGTNPVGTLAGTNAIAYAVRSESCTVTGNFGQRPFAYTAPSGFKALCTQNLPTPTIGATTATQAGKYFNPVLYTGNAGTLAVTGVGFQPDFVWAKGRSVAYSHGLFDAVRGATKKLTSNSQNAEATESGLTAFNSDGFTLGSDVGLNSSSATYVSWNWIANGAGSSNTAGSITATVSANTTAGFSVVTYTGTGANATVGHGLGVAPSMLIIKRRNDVVDWAVYHASLGATKYMNLNLTDAAATASTPWNNTAPTSTVFSIGTASSTNVSSSATYVAYCFAPIAGYSAFGSFVGNGSADGAFVYTGFRPAFVMLKASSTGGAGYNWGIFDNDRLGYNSAQRDLRANTTDTEGTDNNLIDFLSNGFKIRSTSGGFGGGSGVTYIYMAFAENPFKYSLAR